MIIDDRELVVAAAGLRRPRVVVSKLALARLDPAELEAGLEHERGHIVRRHRFISAVASVLFALSRLIPGSRRAVRGLDFHLERDADDYAVRRTGDGLALAGAICKAAISRGGSQSAVLGQLAGGDVTARVDLLMNGVKVPRRSSRFCSRALALFVTFAALGLVAATPALARVGLEQVRAGHLGPDCRA